MIYEVSVVARDGIVTLIGTIDCWTERGAAEDNTYQAGAKSVSNMLDVRYVLPDVG
jgi:osmotically-inducible protein OsmY